MLNPNVAQPVRAEYRPDVKLPIVATGAGLAAGVVAGAAVGIKSAMPLWNGNTATRPALVAMTVASAAVGAVVGVVGGMGVGIGGSIIDSLISSDGNPYTIPAATVMAGGLLGGLAGWFHTSSVLGTAAVAGAGILFGAAVGVMGS